MRARAVAAAVLCIAPGLPACSAIPKAEAMRVDRSVTARQQPGVLGVHVSGGQDFDFRISDEQFEAALRESLTSSGVFARLAPADGGDWRLDVVLGDGRGIEGTELTVLWSLSRPATHETVWQELVTSKGRSFHFVGVTRNRRHQELAARENIRLGIEALSRVELGEP